jgi:hypothetical protein
MTHRRFVATFFRMAVLAAAIPCAAGCRGSPSEEAKQDQSVWTPDPKVLSQLKQTGEVGDYRLLLPADFAAADAPGVARVDTKSRAWKGKAGAGQLPALLLVDIKSDEEMVNKGKKDMRQVLVDFSAGVTDASGIQITKREKTETGTLDGLQFSRFRWSGSKADQTAVHGYAYGAIDNRHRIIIIAMNFGPNAETENKVLESVIATFKKR